MYVLKIWHAYACINLKLFNWYTYKIDLSFQIRHLVRSISVTYSSSKPTLHIANLRLFPSTIGANRLWLKDKEEQKRKI